MSTRSDLPKNDMADEYRKIVREATIEYLRDKTSRDERKEIIKEALHEWMQAKFAEFGWFSFKTLGVIVISVFVFIYLIMNGWHK